jgi:hypothetical protein
MEEVANWNAITTFFKRKAKAAVERPKPVEV